MSQCVREQSITRQGTIQFTPDFQANICEERLCHCKFREIKFNGMRVPWTIVNLHESVCKGAEHHKTGHERLSFYVFFIFLFFYLFF